MGVTLIPFAFFWGAVIATALLRSSPASVWVDLAQPIPVATYWQHFGGAVALVLIGALAIASVVYVRLLQMFTGAQRAFTLRGIVALSACSCAAALVFPVIFSSDVYAYAAYGDMSLHGLNPYAHQRIAFRDPLIDAALWQWGNPPPVCVYGPLFVALARAVVMVFLPLGPAAPLWALRICSCLALVACAPLANFAFGKFSQRTRLLAAAGVALNPLAVWASAEGHNDAIALAMVLGGLALAARGRVFAGAVVAALCLAIKGPAPWATWHLAGSGRYVPQFSSQSALASFVPLPMAAFIVAVACVLAIAWGAIELRKGRLGGALAIALSVWIAIPNPYPWYALWILPVAFLRWNTAAAWAIVAATLLAALRYYPEATGDVSTGGSLLFVALQFGVPLLIVTVGTARERLGRRENRTPALALVPLRLP